MTDFSDYTETEIRDWMSQGTDMDPAPTSVYLALHTADPGETGASEVAAGDYARVETTAGTDWNTPASNQFENANEETFGVATSSWGTVTHVSLWDTATGGNVLAQLDLGASKEIAANDEAKFPAGNLTFTVN